MLVHLGLTERGDVAASLAGFGQLFYPLDCFLNAALRMTTVQLAHITGDTHVYTLAQGPQAMQQGRWPCRMHAVAKRIGAHIVELLDVWELDGDCMFTQCCGAHRQFLSLCVSEFAKAKMPRII